MVGISVFHSREYYSCTLKFSLLRIILERTEGTVSSHLIICKLLGKQLAFCLLNKYVNTETWHLAFNVW